MKLTTELLEKIRACYPASKALADSGGSVEVDAAFVARLAAEHPDWLVWLMGRWVEGLSALLAAGAEVNARDGYGLHRCIGRREMARRRRSWRWSRQVRR